MKTRLFHAIIACGAALAAPALGCDAEQGQKTGGGRAMEARAAGSPARGEHADRCTMPDGTCFHMCTTAGIGRCIDPCFVHTAGCSPDCLQPDGSCGWPPTK